MKLVKYTLNGIIVVSIVLVAWLSQHFPVLPGIQYVKGLMGGEQSNC